MLHQETVDFLIEFHFFDDKNSRKALLLNTGVEAILPDIDLSGAPREFVTLLVNRLDEYGALPDGRMPIIELLQSIKTSVGGSPRERCDELIAQWQQQPRKPRRQPKTNVPLQRPARAAHFTGRQNELAQLLRDVQPGQVVTLCGPGGIGKSALAAEAVWQMEPERFPDGVIFHTFYGQPDPNVALEHIARSCGVDPQPNPFSAALRALAGKRALLLLDGTEEAQNLQPVLDVRGGCGVLITSRKRQDAVAARQDVPPLPTNEALQLLRAWGGERLAADLAAQRICELVGGLPLAVRLVGRYLNETSESTAEYLAWLQTQPIDALDHGTHRHESVNVLLTRSLQKLSTEAVQVLAVFGRLAFAPVSRAVVAAALPGMELRRPLNELVNYGLLLRDGDRYSVSHALIHTYVRERCPSPVEVAAHVAAYYTKFAREQITQGLTGYNRLDAERSHILRVLVMCQERKMWQAVSELVKAVAKYLDLRGYWADYQAALELNLIAAQQQSDHEDEGWCANQLGLNCWHRGRVSTAFTYLEESLAIIREIGNKAGEGSVLNNLSLIYHTCCDYAMALTFLEQSLAIQREIGDKDGEGTTLNNISQIYDACGDSVAALTHLEQSLSISREIGDKAGEGTRLNNISHIYYARGDSAAALSYLEQSLAIHREVGNKTMEGTTLNNLSQIYDARGNSATALKYLEESLAIFREIGDKAGEGTTMGNLGKIYYAQGAYEKALTYFEQSLAIQREIGDKAGEGVTLWNLGALYSDSGQMQPARQSLQAAQAIFEAIQSPYADGVREDLNRLPPE